VDAPELDEAIAALAAALAPRLVGGMGEGDVADLRAELVDRLTAELLRLCGAELGLGEPAPPLRPPEEDAGAGAVGFYAYGIVRSGVPISPEPAGVDPATPVRLVEFRGLAALVSEVPIGEFDLRRPRGDLPAAAWLEEVERGHERVLAAALAQTAVIPLRICSVHASEDQVVEMLAREYGFLLDALERLGGRAEWNVAVFAAEGAIEREALRLAGQADPGWIEEPTPGTGWAREIHAELSLFADEALVNPVPPLLSDGHGREMLLNGVYLVDDERARAFCSVARELGERFARRGVEVLVDGPCPAHNFVKGSIEAAR
jgi:hypothetical protein